MAKEEHLTILSHGVEVWNHWRNENSEVKPDLIRANLSKANLRLANLSGASLNGADLSGIDLSEANLSQANLRVANLAEANLNGVNFGGADLSGADLDGAILYGANLRGTNLEGAFLRDVNLMIANLIKAKLNEANLSWARLNGANLSGVNLSMADLRVANLSGANLRVANLRGAYLCGANLSKTVLGGANLSGANLGWANLSNALLTGANLSETDFTGANLKEANLGGAILGWTSFADVDLSEVNGLDNVYHLGPSTIGMDTLEESKGKIPSDFLRQCGMLPWQVEIAHLFNPALTADQIKQILTVNVPKARTEGTLYFGGFFISYSHADSGFADKLYRKLKDKGASVWLDRHDLGAGSLEKQISRAIKIKDIVVVVLSKNSVEGDWIEHELEIVRQKESEENRYILCPIALDDTWNEKVDGSTLWEQLRNKTVLDFSKWKTKQFDTKFKKMLDGLKINC